MTGYKIQYNEWGYDCWGAPERGFWKDKPGPIYTSESKAKEAMNKLPYRSDTEYRVVPVEIVMDEEE